MLSFRSLISSTPKWINTVILVFIILVVAGAIFLDLYVSTTRSAVNKERAKNFYLKSQIDYLKAQIDSQQKLIRILSAELSEIEL